MTLSFDTPPAIPKPDVAITDTALPSKFWYDWFQSITRVLKSGVIDFSSGVVNFGRQLFTNTRQVFSDGTQVFWFPDGPGISDSSLFVGNGGANVVNLSGGADLGDLTGRYNTGLGMTNMSNLTSGSYNTGIGFETMQSMTTGVWNTAVGEASMIFHSAFSNHNTALGTKAFCGLVTGCAGDYNIYIGDSAGINHYQGDENIIIGTLGMQSCATGSRNIGIGRGVLFSNLSGNDNIVVGYNSGTSITSGSGNTIIGNAQAGASTLQNTLIIATDGGTVIFADDTAAMINKPGANTARISVGSDGNVRLGLTTLATTADDGFPCIPLMNGAPTGVPDVGALVYDVAGARLWVHLGGGAWV